MPDLDQPVRVLALIKSNSRVEYKRGGSPLYDLREALPIAEGRIAAGDSVSISTRDGLLDADEILRMIREVNRKGV